MLLKHALLQRIAAGEVDLVFRRWKRPTVRTGGTLKTSIGVLAIQEVVTTTVTKIRTEHARRAGYASRADLVSALQARDGDIYRICVSLAGPDPRIALRAKRISTAAELAEVHNGLRRLDRASRDGAWTRQYLTLIADNPGTRAVELAAIVGQEKKPFKARVRKLKERGLTESLEKGYRLSPRGKSYLRKAPAQ